MKIKSILPLLALLFTVISISAQKPTVRKLFTLEGIINGMKDGVIYLRYAGEKGDYKNDSATIKEARFRFQARTNGPAIAFLTTVQRSLPDDDERITSADGKNAVLFFLEPASMHVVLDTSDFKNARITGSQSQIDLATYNEATKTGNILPGFIEQHPDSYVSAYLITCHHFPLDTLRYFYSSLTRKVKRCVYGKIIFQNIHRKELVAVGKRAPAFSQEDRSGKLVSLKELRGKYVLLQFWGSWNMASKMENREILHAYNSYKNKNLAIIGVSLDGKKTRKTWLAAIEKDSLSWTQLAPLKAADNPVAIKYDVETLPANFLIDPAGRIIATDLKGEVLRKTFERIFPSVSTR